MEMRCLCNILHISYKDHGTNEEGCSRIEAAISPFEDLLKTVKKHKLKWYSHICHSTSLAKIIYRVLCQEEVGGVDNGRCCRTTARSGQACPSAGLRRQPWIKWLGGKLSHCQWYPNDSLVKEQMRDEIKPPGSSENLSENFESFLYFHYSLIHLLLKGLVHVIQSWVTKGCFNIATYSAE